MSMTTTITAHPLFPHAISDLCKGAGIAETSRKYGLPYNNLQAWWLRNRDRSDKVADLLNRITEMQDPEPTVAEATVTKLAEDNNALRLQIAELEKKYDGVSELFEALNIMQGHSVDAPEWLAPSKAEGKHGTVCAVLSDLHLDEVVRKQEVGGVNAFNRRIAEMRLQRFFEKAVELPRDYLSNITYDGFVLMCLGDTFTGEIHEELAATNEGHPFETLLYFLDPFVSGIRLLAEQYGKVHVVSVPGNHDRTYKKPRYKGRVVTSLHYLFMKFVEREFKGDERVTFQAPESPDAIVKVYDTTFLATHGDQFKGGNGIGGIMVPLLRGHAKRQQRQQAIRQGYDVMVMGHWHQYIAVPSSGLIINGTLKGFDEYSYGMGFNYEPAQQALWVTTPEHGATGFHLPIVVEDKKTERW